MSPALAPPPPDSEDRNRAVRCRRLGRESLAAGSGFGLCSCLGFVSLNSDGWAFAVHRCASLRRCAADVACNLDGLPLRLLLPLGCHDDY